MPVTLHRDLHYRRKYKMITYTLALDYKTNQPTDTCILRSDGWCIPLLPDNTDAQEFGRWLQAGNTPTAPEGTTLPDNFVINTLATLGIS
jgi:hypothetical protein